MFLLYASVIDETLFLPAKPQQTQALARRLRHFVPDCRTSARLYDFRARRSSPHRPIQIRHRRPHRARCLDAIQFREQQSALGIDHIQLARDTVLIAQLGERPGFVE